MTVIELLILLLVAAVCGCIAQSITGFSRGGLLVAIALGFIGALLARNMSLPEPFALQIGDVTFPVLWSIVGASLFVALISLMTRDRYVLR